MCWHCFRHRKADTSRATYFRGLPKAARKSYDVTVNGTQGGESRVHNPRMRNAEAIVLSSGMSQRAVSLDRARLRRGPDVPFVPTPQNVGRSRAKLARCEKEIFLRFGFGRSPYGRFRSKLSCVKEPASTSTPKRIQEANENAKKERRRKAWCASSTRTCSSPISATRRCDSVSLYPDQSETPPEALEGAGVCSTRIVSHSFDMGDREPQRRRTSTVNPIFLERSQPDVPAE